jgi:LysR family transcriptional regulator, carnitine catabolism transcriptional activator
MTATLKQLEAFVAVARTGSFTAAAKLVHVSQPALTAMIKKLEEQLRVTLFERAQRGAVVTTAGRELLPTVDRLIGELNETLAAVLRGTSPSGGTVTIACVPSVASIFLPPLIVEFSRRHPRTSMVVRDAMPENRGIVGLLRSGDADIGIASPLEEAPELQFRPLYEDEMVALLPPEHPACASGTVDWETLARMPLIGMAHRSMVRLLMDRTFARMGISKRPITEVSLITTAVGMARAGLGAAVMPNTAAQSCNLTGLAVVSIVEPVVKRPIGFLFGSMATLSPAARSFVQFVLEKAEAHRGK